MIMLGFIKKYCGTLIFFTLVGLVGGFFVGLYLLDGYPESVRAELILELEGMGVGGDLAGVVLGVITAFQSAGYGLVLGAAGIYFAKRVGLWRDEKHITKKPLMISALAALVCGAVMILSDVLFFGRYSDVIMSSYAAKPSLDYIIATVTYAAVIEEVMCRLLAMSLAAFLLHRLFEKNKEMPSTFVLISANLISAMLFAAGHLPVTVMMIGTSPLIIFRCFLLNGGLGLVFGWLYRRWGLRYAMIAHGGCHVVSKLIWVLLL